MDDPPAAQRGLELQVDNPCGYADVRRRELRPWLAELVGELAPAAASFAVRFTSDREMRMLNRTYRGIDKSTDVLSFPGETSPAAAGSFETEGWHLGDVVVAVPAARRQAEGRGHSVARELRTLLLHGVLHCLGHDHETDDGTMERLERQLRRRWVPPDVARDAAPGTPSNRVALRRPAAKAARRRGR
jgi:probable rRNA maturation factor